MNKVRSCSLFVIGMISVFNLSALAQYDDTPGVYYSNWAVSQVCRMTADRTVSIAQANRLIIVILMSYNNPYYNAKAAQDYLRFLDLDKKTKLYYVFKILESTLKSCPNNIARTEFNGIKLVVSYYNTYKKACTRFNDSSTKCLEDQSAEEFF